MSFKYINPGYAELLDVSGGTTVSGEQYGKFGVAFHKSSHADGIILSQTPNEIYCRFDVYVAEQVTSDTNVYVALPTLNDNIRYGHGARLYFYSQQKSKGDPANGTIYGLHGMTQQIYTSMSDYFKVGEINTVWFHVVQSDGVNTHKITMRVNGKPVSEYTTGGSTFPAVLKFGIGSTTPCALISNIIVSDEEIDPNETIALLPISATETNMADQHDGSYAANNANQTLLQSIAVQSLIDEYGENSEIRGLALVGMPAYRTGGGITRLTAIEKYNSVITEYGTKNLSDNTSAGIIDCRRTSLTLADMAGRQFGWKSKA